MSGSTVLLDGGVRPLRRTRRKRCARCPRGRKACARPPPPYRRVDVSIIFRIPVNSFALAAARADGFSGPVVILDVDAHPPDGLAECFEKDPDVWYLAALEALLARRPTAKLAFVIAGGDVLAGDRLGALGLSLKGARRRDARIFAALGGTPSVWLPGGGYHDESWRIFAGVGLVLAGRPGARVRPRDPMAAHYRSRPPLRERDVPARSGVAALRRPGAAQAAPDGGHLCSLGAHHPSRHRQRLAARSPGARRGADAPGAGHDALHDQMVTPDYHASLLPSLKRHLVCRIVDELTPIVQKHQIEGLVRPAGRGY